MTTNYGARPGLSDAAGKFSGSDLMAIGEHIVAANERARKAESELDAERAAHAAERERHAATLDMCERALAFVRSMPDADNVSLADDLSAAIAQARGERGAK